MTDENTKNKFKNPPSHNQHNTLDHHKYNFLLSLLPPPSLLSFLFIVLLIILCLLL